MDKKKQAQMINDHRINGLSHRILAQKYGIGKSTVHRIIMRSQKQEKVQQAQVTAPEASLPDDIKALKEELRKAKLKIELQDLMIDIAGKELGMDIRKKSGTRRS